MGEFSLMHWVIILFIVLFFFGPSKLPGLGKSLGKAIRDFKSGLNDAMDENDAKPAQQQQQAERPVQSLPNTEAPKTTAAQQPETVTKKTDA